jgi:hypothetical protein
VAESTSSPTPEPIPDEFIDRAIAFLRGMEVDNAH